jgi:hypothetical protein
VTVAAIAVSVAGLAGVVTSTQAAADSPGRPHAVSALDPSALSAFREMVTASRSEVRATPTPSVTPTVSATPTIAPIVGTFPPVPGCTATVPQETPPNGRLSESQLCPIGDDQMLRADAAATFVALDAAYEAAVGSPICVTDSYRSYSSQVSLYGQKPSLAAVPGTSNHGWGVAVDVFCGIDSYYSSEHEWMSAHAPDFGWTNPDWARDGGGREEPWHWEFDPALLG